MIPKYKIMNIVHFFQYDLKAGIKNLFYFFPVVWKWRWWDWNYTNDVLIKSLLRMAEGFNGPNAATMDCEKQADRMIELASIFKEMRDFRDDFPEELIISADNKIDWKEAQRKEDEFFDKKFQRIHEIMKGVDFDSSCCKSYEEWLERDYDGSGIWSWWDYQDRKHSQWLDALKLLAFQAENYHENCAQKKYKDTK